MGLFIPIEGPFWLWKPWWRESLKMGLTLSTYLGTLPIKGPSLGGSR